MSQRALTDLQQQSFLTQAKLSKKFKKNLSTERGTWKKPQKRKFKERSPSSATGGRVEIRQNGQTVETEEKCGIGLHNRLEDVLFDGPAREPGGVGSG